MRDYHLVLQSPTLSPEQCEAGAAMFSAQAIQILNATAARLRHVQPHPATRLQVDKWSQENAIDYAFIPTGSQLSQCKVLALDMDSTLINIECIDELADIAGVKDQVAAITRATMRGEIPNFAQSVRRRVALLAGLSTKALERVYTERLRLNPGARTLITRAQHAGLKILLVSGGFTFFTDRLRTQLKLDEAFANVLEIEAGTLTGRLHGDIVDGEAKAAHLRAFAQRHDATPAQIIAIGDGANDLPMLALAHYSVAYHAKPIVRQHARFALNVSSLDGVLNWFEN